MQIPALRIGDLVANIPIVQGGMGVGISLSGLASAVANEGGIGVIAAAMIGMVAYAQKFFAADASGYPAQFYSHVPRWETTSRIKLFYSAELKEGLPGNQAIDDMSAYLRGGRAFDSISQAQYVEAKTLLPGYLLSSQGDRVAMAHSIEARYPFLDHRVIEFCAQLPVQFRMRALTEKYILKKSMHGLLPRSIVKRTKQPYRSPDAKSIFQGSAAGEYLDLESQVVEQKKKHLFALEPRAVVGDNAYCKAMRVRTWAVEGVLLLTPAATWQTGRYAVAYHRLLAKAPFADWLYCRKTAIEPVFDLFSKLLGTNHNHKQLPLQSLAKVQSFLALAVLALQITMIVNHAFALPLRQMSILLTAFS